MPALRDRPGVTLLELMIALTIVGISSAVVLLSWQWQETEGSIESGAVASIADARRRAIASGRTERLHFRLAGDGTVIPLDERRPGSTIRFVTVRADGSVVADPAYGVDRLGRRAMPSSLVAP